MCECLDQVNEKLSEQNTILDYSFLADNPRAIIATCKIESRKKLGPIKLFAAFCPFCGVKYEEENE